MAEGGAGAFRSAIGEAGTARTSSRPMVTVTLGGLTGTCGDAASATGNASTRDTTCLRGAMTS
jgi:hypothetical protein